MSNMSRKWRYLSRNDITAIELVDADTGEVAWLQTITLPGTTPAVRHAAAKVCDRLNDAYSHINWLDEYSAKLRDELITLQRSVR